MRRRDFIVGIGNSAAIAVPASLSWPIAVRAQRRQVSVIGYLDGGLPERSRDFIVTAVRRGLAESGYVEGQNLLVEYRWADDHLERLRTLADDLVWRGVAAIITTNTATTLAARPRQNQFR